MSAPVPARYPITAGQIRAIHAALTAQGIEDATYREMLQSGWSAKSCKDLSTSQANSLLNHLNGRPRRPRRRQPIRRPARPAAVQSRAGVVRLPSPAQHQLIVALVSEVHWRSTGGYAAWLKRSLGLDRVRTAEDAQRVINGLKGLKRRAKR